MMKSEDLSRGKTFHSLEVLISISHTIPNDCEIIKSNEGMADIRLASACAQTWSLTPPSG